jgi:hypothetical protein
LVGWHAVEADTLTSGFAGSFVVSVFPKPTSAKKLVRQGLSKNIAALGELFGLEVTAFERSRDEAEANVKERRERYRTHFLAIFVSAHRGHSLHPQS